MAGYKNDLMESKKRTRTTRKTNLILFYLESYFLFLVHVGFFPPSTAFLCQAAKFKALKGPLFWQWTLSRGLTLFVCSVPVEAQDQCPCILGILLWYLYQEKDEITEMRFSILMVFNQWIYNFNFPLVFLKYFSFSCLKITSLTFSWPWSIFFPGHYLACNSYVPKQDNISYTMAI